jgi:hypothetical protein
MRRFHPPRLMIETKYRDQGMLRHLQGLLLLVVCRKALVGKLLSTTTLVLWRHVNISVFARRVKEIQGMRMENMLRIDRNQQRDLSNSHLLLHFDESSYKEGRQRCEKARNDRRMHACDKTASCRRRALEIESSMSLQKLLRMLPCILCSIEHPARPPQQQELTTARLRVTQRRPSSCS